MASRIVRKAPAGPTIASPRLARRIAALWPSVVLAKVWGADNSTATGQEQGEPVDDEELDRWARLAEVMVAEYRKRRPGDLRPDTKVVPEVVHLLVKTGLIGLRDSVAIIGRLR